MNFVPCVTWVRRGVAKSIPEKVQLSKDELKKLIEESITDIQDLKVENDEEGSTSETEGNVVPENEAKVEHAEGEMDVDIVAKYNLDAYEEDSAPAYVNLGQLAEFSDDEESEAKGNDQEQDSEDEENFKIRPEDNLLAVGHVTEDCSVLEVYVYNEEDDDLYVHHDIILPAFPVCMECISYGPNEDKPSNYLAVGDMTPIINIWDLDMVDIIEPIGKLGKKLKKKDKKNLKGAPTEFGHGDAVLDLSWNKHLGHALASGSADFSTILWDLSSATPVTWLKDHKEKVQCVEWHPFEAEMLLTGSSDKHVLLYDARATELKQSWNLKEEVEKLVWNHFDPFCFLAGTDAGNIFCFDVRQRVPLFTIDAHAKSISDMSLSATCPGLLVSTGTFTSLKIWDIRNNQPQLVKSQKLKEGNLLACRISPDSPFTVAIGGDRPSSNFKVLNTWTLDAVRNHFSSGNSGNKPVKSEPVELGNERRPIKSEPLQFESDSNPVKSEPLEFESDSNPVKSEPLEFGNESNPVKSEPLESDSDAALSSQPSISSTRKGKLKPGKVLKKHLSKKKWK